MMLKSEASQHGSRKYLLMQIGYWSAYYKDLICHGKLPYYWCSYCHIIGFNLKSADARLVGAVTKNT